MGKTATKTKRALLSFLPGFAEYNRITASQIQVTKNVRIVRRFCKLTRARYTSDLTTPRIERFVQKLQAEGLSEIPRGSVGAAWHIFRHSFASRLVQRGVSILKVSAWLGHSKVSTTQIYAHLSPDYDSDIEALIG